MRSMRLQSGELEIPDSGVTDSPLLDHRCGGSAGLKRLSAITGFPFHPAANNRRKPAPRRHCNEAGHEAPPLPPRTAAGSAFGSAAEGECLPARLRSCAPAPGPRTRTRRWARTRSGRRSNPIVVARHIALAARHRPRDEGGARTGWAAKPLLLTAHTRLVAGLRHDRMTTAAVHDPPSLTALLHGSRLAAPRARSLQGIRPQKQFYILGLFSVFDPRYSMLALDKAGRSAASLVSAGRLVMA